MPMRDAASPGQPADPDSERNAALRRLRWRSRRGLLENDLVLGRFLERHAGALGLGALRALAELLELPDGDLLDLVLGRTQPTGALDTAQVRDLVEMLRAA